MFHAFERRRRFRTDAWFGRPTFLEKIGWTQVAIAVVAGLLASMLLAFSPEPFRYRLGETTDREIRLKAELKIPNETKTRNMREDYARQSPLVYLHDPEPIQELQRRLASLGQAVANAESFGTLDEVAKAEWRSRLTLEVFAGLKSILKSPDDLPAFNRRLALIFQPLFDFGVLDPANLPPDTDRETKEIQIYTAREEKGRLARQDEVLLPELVKPDGPLALNIRRALDDDSRLKTAESRPANDASTVAVSANVPPLGAGSRPAEPSPAESKPAEADNRPPSAELAAIALFALISTSLRATLTYDAERTSALEDDYRRRVRDIIDTYPKGFLVVPYTDPPTPITEENLRLLRAEHNQLERMRSPMERVHRLLGYGVIVAALIVTIGMYVRIYEPKLAGNPVRLAFVSLVALGTLVVAYVFNFDAYPIRTLPIAATSLLMAIAYNRSFALIVALGISLLSSIAGKDPMPHFVSTIAGTSVGILLLDTIRSRTKPIIVGLMSGLAYGGISLSFGLLSHQPWPLISTDAAWQFACGMLAGFLIGGCLPFLESIFGIVTDISLLELSDTSHPLLQELVRRAPGTYNHSVTVSIIAEAAAARIGANGLVTRVGAMFHDIGKMLKPQYFVENQSADERSKHENLAPAMSTLIIIGHVKDGIELARQHRLPEPILDMIEQHHGTTLVDYFYREATKAFDREEDPDETVEESSFRYPGPKPQTKEAAVLMIADAVESASRSLSEPTPSQIDKVVHGIAMKRLLDGQFDECGLTLTELSEVEESLVKSLTSVYHGRIRYPAAE